ncbi:MAG: hypothetical protein AVO39_04510 [delta proteobacterium MLS_D]|jgi:trimethylamine---corrinoid protein Co-methyltransferase|nr:MAG: hypothetical protein AVO39_04510 [delta proteobacterium MLS_D]
MPRQGLLIPAPLERLSRKQIDDIHRASLAILSDPGLVCYNDEAASIFAEAGADVSVLMQGPPPYRTVKIPPGVVERGLQSAPAVITLGARNSENALVMDGREPRVYFVTGSEANTWVDAEFPIYVKKSDPVKEIRVAEFKPRRGMLADLCLSARLSEHLETLDGFIRNVNIQDADITEDIKDVNKVYASLDNTTKHVMVGLTKPDQLDTVLAMASIIAGDDEKLQENPILSFITCLVKSPLQFVDETTGSFIDICRRGIPVAVSSSPQAGTTAPIHEAGIIAQINAEVLAGIVLGQLVNPGTPILYGTVPVRTRMDNLADSYGAVETSQYTIDCTQLARYYGIPNYSTSGVCDPAFPGQQSTVERLFSNILVTLSGPQYLHCAYGLLDCNAAFSPLQAVIDDTHFSMIKYFFQGPRLDGDELETMARQIREVLASPHKLFIRYVRRVLRKGLLSSPYPYEGNEDEVFFKAQQRMEELLSRPVNHIERETAERVFRDIPGLLPRLHPSERDGES